MNSVFIISGLGIFSLLSEIFNFRKILFPVVLIGLVIASVVSVLDWNTAISYYNDMLFFDNYAIAFVTILSLVALLWFIMCKDYLQHSSHVTDHFALLLFALTGAIFMVAYHNMVMLFLGIETLSISLYVLAGSRMKDLLSNEAAFKYFLMGAFSTGFLLFGIALIYGATGSFHLIQIKDAIMSESLQFTILLYAGILMIFTGLAFKVSAVPFHFWAPDVYHGSPTVVTAFMSTIVKIAAFAAFFRLFSICFSPLIEQWVDVAVVITILTLLVSNLTATYQKSIKRMLAYSSIAHAGYLLIMLVTMNDASSGIILYYVAVYSFATIGAFSVLHSLNREKEDTSIEDFHGLAKRNPFAAIVMTVSLLSLAGIPPLAGFMAKYMIFVQALREGYTTLVIVAIVTSLIAVYYYFQIIIAMVLKESGARSIPTPAITGLLWVLIMLLTIGTGLFPGYIVNSL